MSKKNQTPPDTRVGSTVKPRRVDCGLRCDDPSLTEQQYLDECDINKMMERYQITGQIPRGRPMPSVANYGDFTTADSYQQALEVIQQSRDQFDSLPSRTRERFGNDPANLLAFIQSAGPGDLGELQALGFLNAPAVKSDASSPTPGAPPPAPPGGASEPNPNKTG